MMHFQKIDASEVRPGALLMLDLGKHRVVRAIRKIDIVFGTFRFRMAETGHTEIYGRGEKVWVAQR